MIYVNDDLGNFIRQDDILMADEISRNVLALGILLKSWHWYAPF